MAMRARSFLTRRQLFGIGIAGAAAGLAAVTVRFLWPLGAKAPAKVRIDAGDVPEPYGEPVEIYVGSLKAYVLTVGASESPEVVALSRKCSFDSCTVHLLPGRLASTQNTRSPMFRCPCCGSQFSGRGDPVKEPAVEFLSRLQLTSHASGDVTLNIPWSATDYEVKKLP
jgi:Rieske Fe-S protein